MGARNRVAIGLPYRVGIFKLCIGAQESIVDSASLCSLVGRYVKPIPTRFQLPMAVSKIGPQVSARLQHSLAGLVPWNRFLGSLKV
jgi:hypothetical protein